MALQTTSGSLREKWVAAFLPTAAIILVAFLYFNFSLNPEMKEVENMICGEKVTGSLAKKLAA